MGGMGGMGGGRRGTGSQRGGHPGFTFRFGWHNSLLILEFRFYNAFVKINE
jgi:hypothetical protein